MKKILVGVIAVALCPAAWGQEAGKVDMELRGLPLEYIIKTVGQMRQASYMLDPMAQVDGKAAKYAPVIMTVKNVPLTDLMRKVVEPMWLEADEEDGLMFITDNAGAEELVRSRGVAGAGAKAGVKAVMDPNVPKDMLAKLTELKVSRQGPEPIRKATVEVAKAAGFKVRYDMKYRELGEGPITQFAVYDMSLASWLNWAARVEGLAWMMEGDTIVITDRVKVAADFVMQRKLSEKKVSVDYKDKPWSDVMVDLVNKGDCSISMGGAGLAHKTVTLKLDETSLETVMNKVGEQLGQEVVVAEGSVWMYKKEDLLKTVGRHANMDDTWVMVGRATEADLALKEKIRTERVSFSFDGITLKEALEKLAELGKVGIVTAGETPREERGISLYEMQNTRLEEALTLVAQDAGRKCSIIGGKIVVGDEKEIREMSAGGK